MHKAGPFGPRLVVMVKEPAAGRVKTRLARGIGVVARDAVLSAHDSGRAGAGDATRQSGRRSWPSRPMRRGEPRVADAICPASRKAAAISANACSG